MKEIAGKKVILTEGEFLRREEANKRYLMKLETPYLLRSYLHEAGRYSGRGPDAEAFPFLYRDPDTAGRSCHLFQ